MSDHKLTRKTGGRMETGWIQPVCTCGWEGRKEYAYNDYQKQLDDCAEIEALAEQIEQEMREELLAGDYYALEYRNGLRTEKTVYDRDNVVDQMIELDAETFNQAVMMTSRDPIEAARIMTDLMKRAVEQVIALAPIQSDAEYRIETQRSKAA